jgi:hypothetical protein
MNRQHTLIKVRYSDQHLCDVQQQNHRLDHQPLGLASVFFACVLES